MLWRLIPLVFLLTACNTGGPGFRGIDPVAQDYDGSRFLIRRNGPLVEVLRVSPEAMPSFRVVARKAGLLTQRMTGCRAAWVRGDQAMMVIGLSCDGAKPPKKPKRRARFGCDVDRAYRLDSLVELEFQCFRL
ncbi:hypothetical protein ACOXXX_14125 [Thalassococcus sp. BH17M4-6]|uniref:hypothetical protein n=1 Tax=Thalassococcus sp. BH17M4-6 TaxID=3413148 RepID=UPI003BCCAA60